MAYSWGWRVSGKLAGGSCRPLSCLPVGRAGLAQSLTALLEYRGEFLDGVGPQHGYTSLLEIGDALEYGTRGQVPACVEYAAVFVDTLHVDAELLLEHIYLLVERQGVVPLGCP